MTRSVLGIQTQNLIQIVAVPSKALLSIRRWTAVSSYE